MKHDEKAKDWSLPYSRSYDVGSFHVKFGRWTGSYFEQYWFPGIFATQHEAEDFARWQFERPFFPHVVNHVSTIPHSADGTLVCEYTADGFKQRGAQMRPTPKENNS